MKELTLTAEAKGDDMHIVTMGTYANGKPVDEGGPEGSTYAWDGKEHVLHESSPRIVIACTPPKDREIHLTVKRDGKLVERMRVQISSNGQTATETSDMTDEQGHHSKRVLVYEKQ